MPFSPDCALNRFSFHPGFFFLILLAFVCIGCSPSRDTLLANAAMHRQAGEIDTARQIYQRILDDNAYDIDALQGMIAITQNDANSTQQEDCCRRLLQLCPWDRHANVVIGKQKLQEGNLKDAALRFYMAYTDSDFAQDKKEILQLLEEVRAKEKHRIQTLGIQ